MSFKFRIGDIVMPSKTAKQENLPLKPSTVTALQLGDYIQVTPMGTSHHLLVEAADYERFEEETIEFDY
ncbi:MAG TPA: hypothetical protein EYN67_05045 [Flavobacteriales bacterium]|nr:hypothetical protein [Flavobacteriales bacterium]